MVLFPDAPSAQPWEFVLVDKIFQKGGDGAQGISRFLQRHVRSSDATPPGAILRADYRRTIAELNVACDEASYAAVAAACAFQPPRGSISSREDFADACLSVRELAARLANIARSGSGISAVYAPVENSPMTGFATARVPASTRREARAKAIGSNDPDYFPPTRGLPSSPRAPAASSDPNNLLYDNPAGGGDWVGSPGRKEAAASSKNEDEFEFVGSPPAKSSFDSPGRDSQSGMGGFANLRIDVPGDDEPKIPMSPRSPKGMSPRPRAGRRRRGDAPADDAALASPDRAAMRRNEALRARASQSGEVLEKSVTPLFEYPSEHFASDAFPSLDTVEAVEEAMRATADAHHLACRRDAAGGGHAPAGRAPARGRRADPGPVQARDAPRERHAGVGGGDGGGVPETRPRRERVAGLPGVHQVPHALGLRAGVAQRLPRLLPRVHAARAGPEAVRGERGGRGAAR